MCFVVMLQSPAPSDADAGSVGKQTDAALVQQAQRRPSNAEPKKKQLTEPVSSQYNTQLETNPDKRR